jgi:hypothetical protein
MGDATAFRRWHRSGKCRIQGLWVNVHANFSTNILQLHLCTVITSRRSMYLTHS